MIALALDIGEARVGIAVSDATGTLAMPVKVLPAQEVLGNARSFRYRNRQRMLFFRSRDL